MVNKKILALTLIVPILTATQGLQATDVNKAQLKQEAIAIVKRFGGSPGQIRGAFSLAKDL